MLFLKRDFYRNAFRLSVDYNALATWIFQIKSFFLPGRGERAVFYEVFLGNVYKSTNIIAVSIY